MFEMPKLRFADPSEKTIPIWLVAAAALKAPEAAQKLPAEAVTFAAASLFDARPGRHFFFTQADGAPGVVFCLDDDPAADPFQPGALATLLPPGVYRWINAPEKPELAALSFLLGAYKFTRYKSPRPGARLVAPQEIDAGAVESMASCVALARSLIDTPANDLGPDELEAAIRRRRRAFRRRGAGCSRRGAFPRISADLCGRQGVSARAASGGLALATRAKRGR